MALASLQPLALLRASFIWERFPVQMQTQPNLFESVGGPS